MFASPSVLVNPDTTKEIPNGHFELLYSPHDNSELSDPDRGHMTFPLNITLSGYLFNLEQSFGATCSPGERHFCI